MVTITPASALTWRKSASGYALYLRDKGRALATVEPDAVHPGMWHVHQPDGWVSDMARLEWAKDGTVRTVLSQLNRKECGAGSPPIAPAAATRPETLSRN
jgi:hypothetical protein